MKKVSVTDSFKATSDRSPLMLAADEFLDSRRRRGMETYGCELTTHNGRDALLDAVEEAGDLALYLHQAELEGRPFSNEARVARELFISLFASYSDDGGNGGEAQGETATVRKPQAD